jgi:release factor glutamine methyltransferase
VTNDIQKLIIKAHILGVSREEALFVDLSPEQEMLYQNKLLRLEKGVPLDYILGYVDIGSTRIFTPPGVFIPRPITIEWMPELVSLIQEKNVEVIVDYCAGSGLISVLLAPVVDRILAIEKSDVSIQALRQTVEYNRVANINIPQAAHLEIEYLQDFIGGQSWALVCNPPYVPIGETHSSVKYEPDEAIYSGVDGLEVFKMVVSILADMKHQPSFVAFELDPRNIHQAQELLQELNFSCTMSNDSEDFERFLVGVK